MLTNGETNTIDEAVQRKKNIYSTNIGLFMHILMRKKKKKMVCMELINRNINTGLH